MKKRLLLALAIVAALCAVAVARPGGGESFSGGGGHGGGGGGGGEFVFELIWFLLRFIIYYPQIGLPLIAIIVIWMIVSAYRQHQNKDWDSGPPVALHRGVAADAPKPDPDFSQPTFEDFAFRLFSTAQRARNTADKLAAAVGPYVSEPARASLVAREPVGEPVEQVVVGAQRVIRIDRGPERTQIEIEYEANIATKEHTYYTVETWLFGRAAGVASKPPSPSKTFPCPNCGAPWDSKSTGAQQCSSCGQIVDNGRFDWVVDSISLASSDERPPTLTSNPPERGTDLPTYKQSGVDAKWNELVASDPAITSDAFNKRVMMIYDGLNTAWSGNKLEPVRGFVSDGLFDYLEYWVDAYKRQGLRNQLTNMRITRSALAKVVRDKYYDAVTVRLWGTGLDFVVRGETGQVVRGSKHLERPYSEYWTFIRSAARKGPPRSDRACGNCGAPLVITQAGTCDHCGAHVTSGEFDWVLSKIEQDDTYRG
jgi:predicted lipid-binding transport protein (Tim44 family)